MGLNLYVIGFAATWLGWEFLFGRSFALGRHAVIAALLSGLAIPWGGVLLAWTVATIRP